MNVLLQQKIFYKIYMSIMFLVILMMLFIGYLVLQEQEKIILEVMHTQAETVAKSIELVSSDAMITDDQSFLIEHNLNVLEHTHAIRFIAISKNKGELLITRAQEWRLQSLLPEPLKQYERKIENSTITLDPFTTTGEKVYYYTYPLNFNGLRWGWIHIGFSLENLNHAYETMYHKMATIFFFVLLAISIAIYFMTKNITNPIIALNNAAKKMAMGDMKIRLHTTRIDEIGELTKNFDLMAKSLDHAQNRLRLTNQTLEQKVEERTKELAEINHNLDERVRTEIAHRREQEQILIQQSRFAAMGEMIGNIAHQWRQPLNALSLLLQNIENAYDTGRLDQVFIGRVIEKGTLLTTTMSTTIDDFRNFFKPNRSKELFDAEVQLNKVLLMMHASFDDNSIEVILNLEPDLKIYGFSNEFSQVLLNILNNAKEALVEHQKDKRFIHIQGFKHRDEICISITDNAGGIEEDIIEKVFDPYFTTKDEGKGTGIGLYMSKVIIETNMNGRLSARNEAEGATFSIYLPYQSVEAA